MYRVRNKISPGRWTFVAVSLLIVTILLVPTVGLVTFASHGPPGSHLVAAGPVNAANGYPFWYKDSTGLKLELCLNDELLCLLEVPPPLAFPGVFPEEAFWWVGETDMTTKDGGGALLVLAMEAAFDPEVIADGNQISFGRVRIRVDNLIPGATYTVTHPYGTDTFAGVTGGVRGINFSEDIGGLPGDFDGALTSRVGPFLTWDATAPSPPAGFIGDPGIPHTVTGSPFVTNFFRVEGPLGSFTGSPDLCADPKLGDSPTATTDCIETDLFAVVGKNANNAPVAAADAYGVDEDNLLSVNVATGVLSNDIDVDIEPLTAVLVSSPTNGTLTLNADGSFSYMPNGNFNGTDSFTYTADDGSPFDSSSNLATVTITVNSVNDTPVAGDDTGYSVAEDNLLTVSAANGVLANDSDPVEGDLLTAVLASGPANGALTLNADGSFSYMPNPDFNGVDSFTYQAQDTGLAPLSNVAKVTITVTPVNDAPVAASDAYSVDEDDALSVAALNGVLANDSDAEGDSFTAVQVAGTSSGTVSLKPNGSFTYTPDANFNGVDSFTYQAKGPGLALSNVATVTITVNPVNDAPVAGDDAYSVDEDNLLTVSALSGVLANDNDPVDGDPLTAVLATTTTTGTLTLSVDGSFSYMPNLNFFGTDSFTYRARDPGLALSNVATVTITVNPVSLLEVTRLEFKDSELRIRGKAQQNAKIFLDGVPVATAEGNGRFRIRLKGFTPESCQVTVRDVTASAVRDHVLLNLPNCS